MHNSLSESLIPINSEKIQPLKKSSQTLTSTINTNKILFTPEMDNEKKKMWQMFSSHIQAGMPGWCWEKPVYVLLLDVIQIGMNLYVV